MFRTLNVIDESYRGGLEIDVGVNIPASRVIRFLEQLIEPHGRPSSIRCDNGTELTSQRFTEWCREKESEVRYTQPGKPDQNALIERFNRSYRQEVLGPHLFESIADAQEITDDCLHRYNEIRPHDAPGTLPPARYPEKLIAEKSSLELSA